MEKKLIGVHPDLVAVYKKAKEICAVEMFVTEGLRNADRQAKLVASGASWTMNSRHLTGHAIDVAPRVDGQVSWDWPLFFHIAKAMKLASARLNIPVEWGGTWKLLSAADDPEAAHYTYIQECRIAGRKPKADGPHFQLPRKEYP